VGAMYRSWRVARLGGSLRLGVSNGAHRRRDSAPLTSAVWNQRPVSIACKVPADSGPAGAGIGGIRSTRTHASAGTGGRRELLVGQARFEPAVCVLQAVGDR
jgi:hypothetical protein